MRSAVFLDRDGVINDHRHFVNEPAHLYLFDGVGTAIKRLNDAGFFVGVVTNQGGVGLGYLSETSLQSIHAKMVEEVSDAGGTFDAIRYCPHAPRLGCSCRKPKPGMLHELARMYDLDLHTSYMVGDRDVDIQAGTSAGCQTVLVGEDELKMGIRPTIRCTDLPAAVDWILQDAKRRFPS